MVFIFDMHMIYAFNRLSCLCISYTHFHSNHSVKLITINRKCSSAIYVYKICYHRNHFKSSRCIFLFCYFNTVIFTDKTKYESTNYHMYNTWAIAKNLKICLSCMHICALCYLIYVCLSHGPMAN